MKQKMKNLRVKQIIGIVLIVLALIASGLGLIYILNDAKNKTSVDMIVRDIASTVVKPPAPEVVERFGIDKNLLRTIDFDTLKAQNADATRWMYVPNTALDAPVMQEHTVDYYYYDLRGLNGRWNGCGSFLVPAEPIDKNTGKPADDARLLILGHRMNSYNGEWQFSNMPTRWGTAKGASEFPYVYLYYPDHSERWRVWAAIDAWGSDKVYDIPYKLGSDDYAGLIKHIQSLSRYQMFDAPDKDTQILMMSTCNQASNGIWIRFAIVLIPDAAYEYGSQTYIDAKDTHAYLKWASGVSLKRSEAIDAKKRSGLLDGGLGLGEIKKP